MTSSKGVSNTIVVEIKAKWGSKFQHDAALDSLSTMLSSWTTHYKYSHDDNKIEVKFKSKKS